MGLAWTAREEEWEWEWEEVLRGDPLSHSPTASLSSTE